MHRQVLNMFHKVVSDRFLCFVFFNHVGVKIVHLHKRETNYSSRSFRLEVYRLRRKLCKIINGPTLQVTVY